MHCSLMVVLARRHTAATSNAACGQPWAAQNVARSLMSSATLVYVALNCARGRPLQQLPLHKVLARLPTCDC